MSKKEEIMTIACDALQRRGISGFSFRDLADMVGIKSSSVHYHFRSKNDLIKAIIVDFRSKASEYLIELEEKSSSLEEAFEGLIELFEKVLREDKFCVCGMLAAEEKHLDDEVLQELKDTFTGLEKWVTGVATKYEIKSISPEALARLVISSLEGALLIDRVYGNDNYFSALKETVSYLIK